MRNYLSCFWYSKVGNLSKSGMHMKLWDKVFDMTSSWEKTLKWVKHGQINYFIGFIIWELLSWW